MLPDWGFGATPAFSGRRGLTTPPESSRLAAAARGRGSSSPSDSTSTISLTNPRRRRLGRRRFRRARSRPSRRRTRRGSNQTPSSPPGLIRCPVVLIDELIHEAAVGRELIRRLRCTRQELPVFAAQPALGVLGTPPRASSCPPSAPSSSADPRFRRRRGRTTDRRRERPPSRCPRRQRRLDRPGLASARARGRRGSLSQSALSFRT